MRRSEDDIQFGQRMILNSNLGVTNIIEKDVIRRDMGRVTDELFNKLKAHYGPYSSFAGLDANKPLEDTVFTKDGANIVSSIQYASPLEDWIRRAVQYVGKNIESSSGDGTTSSMMFTCGMLKHMNATIDDHKPLSYTMMYKTWRKLVGLIADKMKKYTMSAKDKDGKYVPEQVYKLAYLQAYTSSHGDEELAKAVATMFKRLPSGMWNQMTFKRKRYESDRLFEVVESKYQYEVDAEIMSKTVYNKDAGRYLEYTNATLIVINGRVELDNMYWKDIEKLIDASTPEKPVAIFCTNDFDNATFGTLMEKTRARDGDKMKYCLAVFSHSPSHPKINDFTIIQSIAGGNVLEYTDGEFHGRPYIIEGVTIVHEFDRLKIDGIYEDTRPPTDIVRERCYYTDPRYPYYREFADTIAKFIDAYESAELSHQQKKELKSFKDLYNKLLYDKEICLVIGGKTFDNLAMFDVVDDVIRATIHSLDTGMVISNNKTLMGVARMLRMEYTYIDSDEAEIITWYLECIINTLRSFSDVVLDQIYPEGRLSDANFITTFAKEVKHQFKYVREAGTILEAFKRAIHPNKSRAQFTREERNEFCDYWFSHAIDLLKYSPLFTWRTSINSFTHLDNVMEELDENFDDMSSFIVQPANADIVMLERFGEIAIKFIMTERVIVDGAAYLNKDKKR